MLTTLARSKDARKSSLKCCGQRLALPQVMPTLSQLNPPNRDGFLTGLSGTASLSYFNILNICQIDMPANKRCKRLRSQHVSATWHCTSRAICGSLAADVTSWKACDVIRSLSWQIKQSHTGHMSLPTEHWWTKTLHFYCRGSIPPHSRLTTA